MKIKYTVGVLAIILITAGTGLISNAENITSETHSIEISSQNDNLKVEETIEIIGEANENYTIISFWITEKSSDISININENLIEEENIKISENTYSCNISDLNLQISNKLEIKITYNIEKSETETIFEKKILRDAETLDLNYNGNNRYSAENMKNNTKFSITLFEVEPQQLSIYTIISVLLLIILLTVFVYYFFKKQKQTKKRETIGSSEEYISTKKTLLMSLLKELEKKHRNKKISDDTYSKLKERYKNEAVDAMKKLEDMKSEIK